MNSMVLGLSLDSLIQSLTVGSKVGIGSSPRLVSDIVKKSDCKGFIALEM